MTDRKAANSRQASDQHFPDGTIDETVSTAESVLDPDGDADLQSILADESVEPAEATDVFADVLGGSESDRPGAHARDRPADAFETYHRLTRDNRRVQSRLPFDFVRDDGIIVAGNDYIGLIDVTPRPWFILDDDERTSVFEAYANFVLAIKYPAQELMVPREFDISRHAENVEAADQNAPAEESRVLHHGRRQYTQFTYDTIDTRDVKDPNFYIAVRVDGDHLNPDTGHSGRFGFVKDALESLGSTLGLTSETTPTSPSEAVAEVGERIAEIDDTITRVGVTSEPVTSRDEAMEILYYQYNHTSPPFDEFSHQTYSELLPDTADELKGET